MFCICWASTLQNKGNNTDILKKQGSNQRVPGIHDNYRKRMKYNKMDNVGGSFFQVSTMPCDIGGAIMVARDDVFLEPQNPQNHRLVMVNWWLVNIQIGYP